MITEAVTMTGELAPGRRRAYALAGYATITVQGREARFTYKIVASDPDPNRPPVHFVRVLTGPDNESHYEFLGTIFKDGFRVSGKSRIGHAAPSAVAFQWLERNWESTFAKVWHEGVCGRCGRKLTVPESIETGLGPTCAGYL